MIYARLRFHLHSFTGVTDVLSKGMPVFLTGFALFLPNMHAGMNTSLKGTKHHLMEAFKTSTVTKKNTKTFVPSHSIGRPSNTSPAMWLSLLSKG